MASGRLICCGSSLFLKEKYGVGYSLTMVLLDTDAGAQAAATQRLTNTVNKHLNAAPPTVSGREVTFRLASTESDKFAPLLRALDELKVTEDDGAHADGVITDLGLSITTLEEVCAECLRHLRSLSYVLSPYLMFFKVSFAFTLSRGAGLLFSQHRNSVLTISPKRSLMPCAFAGVSARGSRERR